MKLLFVDFTLPYLLRDGEYPAGGWAIQLAQWLRTLNRLGHRCGVLTWKGARAYVGGDPGCDLLETYDPAAGVRILKYAYLRAPSMYAAARSWAPDAVVQSTRCVETGIMAFIARRLDIPFVYRVASDADVDERYRAGLPGYARVAYNYGVRRAGLVVCQNAYQASQLRRAYPRARLHVQPNVYLLPSDAAEPRPRSARSYIAWLGVFRKPKNLPLLHAIARLLPSIEFRVAGMPAGQVDGETASALEQLRTLSNVRFAGYLRRTEVPGFLAGATALLCTSHYEGFSNTFLEAFAAGTPVITRKGVDPDSLVARHVLGSVAEEDSHLPGCIVDICGMPPAAFDALAANCRRYVEAHHGPTPILRSLVEALAPLVGKRGEPEGASEPNWLTNKP